MPVGCLGNAARGAKEEPFRKNGADNFETILTSSRLNSSDQFAFMQHTLLLQIFRDPDDEDQALSSPSSDESGGSLLCPTCVGFSDQCCQQDNGIDIFNSFIEANLNCHWDLKLSEAISSLRYQGYVCPGILVLIANASHLEVVSDAWHRRLVTSPNGCRISQVGISNGCLVKPIVQTHTISLPDFLCLLLARLKQTEQTVDMETLCKAVERDWNGVAPFCRTNGMENLKETIHTSLGGLIKQRKIYYTGNKGYFLVANDANSSRGGEPKSWRRSLPKRLSFRNSKGPSNNNNNGNTQNSDKECQTDGFSNGQISPGSSTPIGKSSPDKSPVKFGSVSPKSCSDEMSPSSVVANGNESSFNLERSQSLRISRNSLRNISKGGSLRFSKKEVAKLMEEQEEKELSVEANGGEITPPKQFERKNSFLGKIFGGSSKKKGQSSPPKPILATFSAQFPPPEVSEIAADHHATYQALKKAAQSIYNSPPPSLTVPPLIPPHEEEMMYDRPINGHDRGNNSRTTTAVTADNNCPIYSKVSPFRKKDSGNVQQQQQQADGSKHQQNIYSVGSPLSVYGYSVGGTPECVYSYPPPPLPYRPINWTNGPNSLQSSSSSTSSPIQRQINSPTLRQINSPTNRSQNSASPSSTTPGTPQQKLQQQLLNNQQQLQLQQLHQQQQQQIQQYHQLQQNNNTTSPWNTPSKRTANQMSSNLVNSILNTNSTNSTTATSSSSNDSLVLESRTTKPLFNDDLVVIERSNRELELRLAASKQHQQHIQQQHLYHQQHQEQLYQTQKQLNNQLQQEQQYQTQKQLNNQFQQEQQYQQHREQLYQQQYQREKQMQQQQEQQQEHVQKQQKEQQEQQMKEQKEDQLNRKEDSPAAKSGKPRNIRFTLPSSSQKNRSAIVIDTIHNNNIGGFADVIYEECSHSDEVERIKKKISSRPLSECFSASQDNLGDEKSSTPQSFPSIGDLPSLSELSGNATFKSLTAQKLMSGISFNSVDTLLEVNLAAEARNKHNESTETIDFGVI